MTATAQQAPPVVFDTLNGYQRSAALKAGIELGLFTALGEGHNTAAKLAARCQAAERGVRILADYLTIIGLLTKSGEQYALTPESAMLLDEKSPGFMGDVKDFILDPHVVAHFDNLAAAVRKGGTAVPDGGTVASESPVWIRFATAMRNMMRMPAKLIADLVSPLPAGARVLDVAASHGEYGFAVARRNTDCRIVALDWPSVLTLTTENARQENLLDRFETRGGSVFDIDLGTGYDLVLVTGFLHHFNPETIVGFLRRVHASLKPGGRIVVSDFAPAEDRISPPTAAAFALTMLATTAAGDAYTASEHLDMLSQAGFVRGQVHPLLPSPLSAIVASRD